MSLRIGIATAFRWVATARSSDASTKCVRKQRYSRRNLAVLALLGSLSLWASSALAVTYTVTSVLDSPLPPSPPYCAGTICPTLRAAIATANGTPGVADSIVFSVTGTINLGSALPQITDTLTMNNSGITLDGGGGNFSAISYSGSGASGSRLQNYVIRNFDQTLVGIAGAAGNIPANITITGNTLTSMPAGGFAGIRCLNSDNCSATNNTLNGSFGYAISYYNTISIAGYNGTVTGNIVNATTTSSGIGLGSVGGVTVSGNQLSASNSCGINLYQNFAGNTDNNLIENNTISGGAGTGICLTDSLGAQTNSNIIRNNAISGMGRDGIQLNSTGTGGISNNSITGNTITGNGGDGVSVVGANAQNNFIVQNANISGNGGLGIDLGTNGVNANDAGDTDGGPNGLQNFPVLTGITTGDTVNFTLDAPANANGYRIDFYSNTSGLDPTGFGEGQAWLKSCTFATVSPTVPNNCSVPGVNPATLRMTATRCLDAACTTGATSEFNGPATTDLRITKTDGQTIYTPGQAVTYTIVVSNSGASSVSGAVFTDPVVSGLTVASVTCGSPTAGSACPSAANATVPLMQGTGIVIPTLTAGGSVTFTLNATVAAARTGNLTNTASVAPPAGVAESASGDNTVSDTDTQAGTIVIVKDAVPNDAQDFAFVTTGTGLSAFSLDDDADGALPNARTFSGLQPGSYTVTESAIADWALTGLSCNDPDSGTATNLASRIATIDVDSGETVTCTYTNSRRAVLRLQKALPLGRFVVADQFTLQIAGSGAPAPVTTTGSDTTATGTVSVAPATAGTLYTLSETAAAGADLNNYTATYACTNALAGGQTPSGSGSSFSVTPVAGDDLDCTFTNTRRPLADLTISKTNTTASGPDDQASDTLAPGATTTYTIVVTNRGPDAVSGAVLKDPIAGRSRLSCPGPATCVGSACPTATLTVAQLDGGVTLGAMALNDTVTVNLTCTVQ